MTEQDFFRMTNAAESGKSERPPTKISDAAREVFRKWGWSDAVIEAFRDHCASWNYKDVNAKLQWIADRTLHAHQNLDLEIDTVLVPAFNDTLGRLAGHCADMSVLWALHMRMTEKFEKLKQITKLPPGQSLVMYVNHGFSPTHFSEPPFNHVWNSLAVVDEDGEILEEVLIDVGFQTIILPDERHEDNNKQYVRESALELGEEVETSVNIKFYVAMIFRYANGNWSWIPFHNHTIGMSQDGKYSYSLGFCRNVDIDDDAPATRPHSDQLVVNIVRLHANAETEVFFIDPYDPDRQKLVRSNPSIPLSEDEEKEIRGLLAVCERFKYQAVTSLKEIPEHLRESRRETFKPEGSTPE